MTPGEMWLRIVGLLVPGDERGEWIEEWEGELAASGWRWTHALGALPDAWYLRRDGWTMGRMLQDVRHAVKGLARKPFFTALAGITLAIGIVSWTAVARITRSEFLRIRELEYVTASRAAGAGAGKLMFSVILPNAMPPIIVQSALMVGSAILFEAGLSFLGLTDPNVVSWGQIIGSNRQYILDASYTVTIPGLAIFVTVLCISLVGDGLNDALNPKLRQR